MDRSTPGTPGSVEAPIRLPLIALLMAVILLLGVAAVEFVVGDGPARRPNLLLIVLDTVRADSVSFGRGAKRGRDTTPFLRALSREGVTFLHARSTSNWTLPAHASLFTGRLPSEHNCHFEHRYLPREAFTLAESLAAEPYGYETAAFTCNPNVSAAFGFDQGFDRFEEFFPGASESAGDPSAAAIEALVRWASRPGRRPRFAFLNLMDAHLPYRAAEGFEAAFGEVDPQTRRILDRPDLLDRVLVGEIAVDEQFAASLRLAHDNAVRGLDERLRRLFDRLREVGFLDRAVVFVTSDHGENLGDHGLVDHQGGLYESLLRVPLLIHGSRGTGIPRGRVIERPVSLADVYRLVLSASSASFPDQVRAPVLPVVSERFRPLPILDRLAGDPRVRWPDGFGERESLALDPSTGLALRRLGGSVTWWRVAPDAADRGPATDASEEERSHLLSALDRLRGAARPVREKGERAPPARSKPGALAQVGYLGHGSEGDMHARVHVDRGVRLLASGALERARIEFELARSLDPNDPLSAYHLALAAERQGDPDAAGLWNSYLDLALRVGDDEERIRAAMERLRDS